MKPIRGDQTVTHTEQSRSHHKDEIKYWKKKEKDASHCEWEEKIKRPTGGWERYEPPTATPVRSDGPTEHWRWKRPSPRLGTLERIDKKKHTKTTGHVLDATLRGKQRGKKTIEEKRKRKTTRGTASPRRLSAETPRGLKFFEFFFRCFIAKKKQLKMTENVFKTVVEGRPQKPGNVQERKFK